MAIATFYVDLLQDPLSMPELLINLNKVNCCYERLNLD